MKTELQAQFEREGYVVLKQIISAGDCAAYIEGLKTLGSTIQKETWTLSDGVVQNEAFWPIIFDESVLEKVRAALGEDARFLQHNDLHLGYSSFAWHRDGINRSYQEDLPDWQEDAEPYRIARCGFYFQPEENNFHLGVLPGSHKLGSSLTKDEFLHQNSCLSNLKNAGAKIGLKDTLKEKAVWIKTSPGDCILFDPRLIHTGGEFKASKFSIFTAYGVPNMHFKQHYTYYRHLRFDLGYQDMPSDLVKMLRERELYVEEKKYFENIEGAWVPSRLYSMVARLFT